MKSLFIGACLALFAGSAVADHSHHPETRTAEQLVYSLENLSSEARYEEQNAQRNRDYALARDLGDIRDTASNLARTLETRVVWYLTGRASQSDINIARREFSNLRWQFERLARVGQSSRGLPWNISRLMQDVQRQQNQLRYELDNCNGGNDPFPRGNWECNAVDNGWEEHRGGHVGYGRDQRSAEWSAVSACQRVHGACRVTRCVQTGF